MLDSGLDPKLLFAAVAIGAAAVLFKSDKETFVTQTSIGMYFKHNPKLGGMFTESLSKLFDTVQQSACFMIAAASAQLVAQLKRDPNATMSCSAATAAAQAAVVRATQQFKDTVPPPMLAEARTHLGDMLTAVIRCSGSTIKVSDLVARLKEVNNSLCYKATAKTRAPTKKASAKTAAASGGDYGGYEAVPPSSVKRTFPADMNDAIFNMFMSRGEGAGKGQMPVDRLPLPVSDDYVKPAVTRPPFNIEDVGGFDEGEFAEYQMTKAAAVTKARETMPAATAATFDTGDFATLNDLEGAETFVAYDPMPAPAIPMALPI